MSASISQSTNMNGLGQRCKPARPYQGKRKVVTFTGCWTCRSRKVKCDERQQNGCAVCQKSGLECAGYGVNLCWVTGKKKQSHGLRRRQIKFDPPRSPCIREEEINRLLLAIDTISTPSRTVNMGPFGIFQAEDASYEKLDSATSENESNRDCDGRTNITTSYRDGSPKSPNPSDSDRASFELPSNDEIIPNANLAAIELIDWTPLSPGFDSLKSSLTPIPSATTPSPHSGISMPLFNDPNICVLLYHYKNHVANLLQPVLHPMNPWQTTYIPIALEGCPDLFLAHNAAPSSGVSLSLFHSLLSSAAFHLRNLLGDSPEYHKLGLQHKAKALQALNTGLALPGSTKQSTVYLTAMLALVTIDTMTGEDSDFPIHLQGCRQLQKPQLDTTSPDDPARQVNSIRHFLSLLARTTEYKLEPRSLESFKEAAYFDVHDWSIEYIYGITPTLGNLLQKTCQIAESLAFYQDTEIPLPLTEACSAVRAEILAWNIELEIFHFTGPKEQTMLEIIRCQARAFHSAIAIFFYRTTETYHSVDLEENVRLIWANLTLAEDLKDECLGGEKRAAPMSWPAFIAACEASDRKPWVEWWERVQGYAIGNFRRQWRTIQEIWSIMDADRNVASWRDALRQSGKLVLPL